MTGTRYMGRTRSAEGAAQALAHSRAYHRATRIVARTHPDEYAEALAVQVIIDGGRRTDAARGRARRRVAQAHPDEMRATMAAVIAGEAS